MHMMKNKEKPVNDTGKEEYAARIKRMLQTPGIPPEEIPAYKGLPFAKVNGDIPYFQEEDFAAIDGAHYSELDCCQRCGTAIARISTVGKRKKSRGKAAAINPTGWDDKTYDIIAGEYLYNRCHLIAYQFGSVKGIPRRRKLITGTRYLNIVGMRQFEEKITEHLKDKPGNQVLYRVSPIYDGCNKLARGVLMEARFVGGNGKGVCFNVFCYNVQPGIEIEYSSGKSRKGTGSNKISYILNKNTRTFHCPDCKTLKDIKDHHRQEILGEWEECIASGYSPCKVCDPRQDDPPAVSQKKKEECS